MKRVKRNFTEKVTSSKRLWLKTTFRKRRKSNLLKQKLFFQFATWMTIVFVSVHLGPLRQQLTAYLCDARHLDNLNVLLEKLSSVACFKKPFGRQWRLYFLYLDCSTRILHHYLIQSSKLPDLAKNWPRTCISICRVYCKTFLACQKSPVLANCRNAPLSLSWQLWDTSEAFSYPAWVVGVATTTQLWLFLPPTPPVWPETGKTAEIFIMLPKKLLFT